uniref:uncharacterized protein LOC117156412 n=1 Tax=Bombus vancouverensis nearcticus TaxID=2705178 RepID=UPI00143932BF|nr:uncharacterized protein LOC117156412 [Bombus vancouverensis nearcticus]
MSIKMSGFLLKIIGISKATNSTGEKRRKFMVVYTIAALVYGVYVNVVDIYHNLHNLDVTNIGNNGSERLLPFKMWVNLPLTVTPYYEIMFAIEVLQISIHVDFKLMVVFSCAPSSFEKFKLLLLAVQQIGASYLCPEQFLCVLNLHVVYQFRMLEKTLLNLWSNIDEQTDIADYSNKYYIILKKCIRKHQSLIQLNAQLEQIFTLPILSHMVIFSVLMCFDTYEIVLANISSEKRLIFFFHMIGSFAHIIFFTYICHGLVEESTNVSIASYSGWWVCLPMSKTGKKIRKDMKMMMMKAMRPCQLTAGGFFPVNLETSTALCVVNLHESFNNAIKDQIGDQKSDTRLSYYAIISDTKLKSCVQQHRVLIEYRRKLENIFMAIVLGRVISCYDVCLVGFRLFLVNMVGDIF